MLTTIGILITICWGIGMGYYLYISQQQKGLEAKIQELETALQEVSDV